MSWWRRTVCDCAESASEKGLVRYLNALTFAVIADTQRPAGDPLEELKEAIIQVNALRPDFVVLGGDLIDHPTAETCDMQFEQVMKTLRLIEAPKFYIIGNHDVVPVGTADVPAANGEVDRGYAAPFLKHTGAPRTFYSFDRLGYHFVILDTTKISGGKVCHEGTIPEDELTWLRADLAAVGNSAPVVILSHNPLFPADPYRIDNFPAFCAAIRGYKVLASIAAHRHFNETRSYEGVTYFVTGALSFSLGDERTIGYSIVTLRGFDVDVRWMPVAPSPPPP